jgi:hypothetical protein
MSNMDIPPYVQFTLNYAARLNELTQSKDNLLFQLGPHPNDLLLNHSGNLNARFILRTAFMNGATIHSKVKNL